MTSLAYLMSQSLAQRAERFVICVRCRTLVGLREDGTKRAHGTNASPAHCQAGGEPPTDVELGGGRA